MSISSRFFACGKTWPKINHAIQDLRKNGNLYSFCHISIGQNLYICALAVSVMPKNEYLYINFRHISINKEFLKDQDYII